MTYTIQFGTATPMRLKPQTRKSGKGTYLVVTDGRIVGFRGINVQIAAVGGKLHDEAKLFQDGKLVKTIKLEAGTTSTGNPKRSATVAEAVEHEGILNRLDIRVSQPKANTANVLIRTVKPAENLADVDSLA